MKSRGFTLLEMLISIAIFSLVTVIALGAIVMLFGSYSKSQSTQVLVDNLNFALESITRDIRFGNSYTYSNNENWIEVEFEGDTIRYELDVSASDNGRIKRIVNGNDSEATFATAEDIDIETFRLGVAGESAGDGHPRATFLMRGTLLRGNQQSTFALQTTVSQRDSEDGEVFIPPTPPTPPPPSFCTGGGTYYPNTAGSTAWKVSDDTRPSSALVLDSETAYSGAELNTISTDNASGVQGGGQFGGTKIRYTLSEAAADITQLDITISVSDEAMGGSGDVSLYIWNFDTTTWDDSGEGVTSSTKSELNYSITSDITDYVDGSGNFYLVVQSAIGGSSHNSLTYYSDLVVTYTSAVAPDAPTSLTATPTNHYTIDLDWDAPAEDGGAAITGYSIQQRSPAGSGGWTTLVADTGSTDTAYTDDALEPETEYEYQVAAINSAGTSPYSTADSATTSALPGGVPSAPTSPAATEISSSSIVVTWELPVSGAPITSYVVERETTVGGGWISLGDTGSTDRTYTDTGLSGDTVYNYRIRAVNATGTGPVSSEASATTEAPYAPGAPTSLSATATTTSQIGLSWTTPASDGGAAISGYKIERESPLNNGFATIVADTGSTATTYYNTGLTSNTPYNYRVFAINSVGASLTSNEDIATTTKAAPTITTTAASTVTDTTATLNGNLTSIGDFSDADLFFEYRDKDLGGAYTTTATQAVSASGTFSQAITSLTASTTYEFKANVQWEDSGTQELEGSLTEFTTNSTSTAPTSLSATAASDTQINLSWTAPTSDGGSSITGYSIERESPTGAGFSMLVTDTASTDTTYSDTGLTAETQYNYRIAAINAVGTSASSTAAAATTEETPSVGDGNSGGGGGGGGSYSPPTPTPTPSTPPPVTPPPYVPPPYIPPPPPEPVEIPTETPEPPESPVESLVEAPVTPSSPPSQPSVTVTSSRSPGIIASLTEEVKDSAAQVVSALQTTRDNLKQVFESDAGSDITKTVSAAGVLVAGASSASVLFLSPVSVSEIILIPFRIWTLFLSLLGLKRKYRPWGVVYDSVTKQPLDPAYVTLMDEQGNELANSITDLDGRYGFLTTKGTYRIKAHKTNYTFPSLRMAGKSSDELYANLYFGESLQTIQEGETITRNIPLDPENFDWNEFEKRNMKVMRFYSALDPLKAKAVTILFYLGLVVAVVALFIAPQPYNIAIFALYLFLLLLRAMGLKPKSHGYVIDAETGNPLSFAIIRVFQEGNDHEYLHKVADAMGRFYLLLPNGSYSLKVEKKNADESYTQVYSSPQLEVKKGIISGRFLV